MIDAILFCNLTHKLPPQRRSQSQEHAKKPGDRAQQLARLAPAAISRKHALSTISRNNPLFASRIEAIARAICPETADSGSWEQALIIGECTVLSGVSAERIALMEQPLGGTGASLACPTHRPKQ